MKLLDSFTVAESGARKYASRGNYKVILQVSDPRTAREIAPQVRKLVERGFLKSPDATMPLTTDGEAVYVRGSKLRVIRIEKVSTTMVKIHLEEMTQ